MSLAILRCAACGAAAVWPRHACAACGATAFVDDIVEGCATVRAVTLIHRPPAAGDADAGPYAVALIDLDIGGRLMARVPTGVAIGDRVVAAREDAGATPEVG